MKEYNLPENNLHLEKEFSPGARTLLEGRHQRKPVNEGGVLCKQKILICPSEGILKNLQDPSDEESCRLHQQDIANWDLPRKHFIQEENL